MKNRTKGVIAGLAGLALLSGGATFALWTDSATLTGGTITNGNLDVAAAGTVSWYDVSADRTDRNTTNPVTGTSAHTIASIATWRMVPGDVIQGNQGLAVALEGDNLVANLAVTVPAASPIPSSMSLTYQVFYGTDEVTSGPVAVGTPTSLRLMAGRTNQDNGNPSVTGATVVNETSIAATPVANFTVVITATFDSTTTNRVDAQATTVLSNVAVTLTQDRTASSGNGF